MTDQSDIVRKINRLYELWGYEGIETVTTPETSEAVHLNVGDALTVHVRVPGRAGVGLANH